MQAAEKEVWSVEAWRGVAALMVLATHWAPPLGGHSALSAFAFSGVDVFFVLSGFVFAPMVCGRPTGGVGAYAARRFLRIYPAYFTALCLYVAAAAFVGKPVQYLIEHLLMLHVQTREMAFYYNPPFWSLPAEVEFYLLVPLLGWLSRQSWRVLGWAMVVVVAVATRITTVVLADPAAQNMAFVLAHHLPGLLVEFLLGVGVWRALQSLPTGGGVWRFGAVVLGIALYAGGNLWFLHLESSLSGAWAHGQTAALAALGFALVLAATAHWVPGSTPSETLIQRGGWLLGRWSYSIYLLHSLWVPVIERLIPPWGPLWAGVAATMGLGVSAWLLHASVEGPMRAWGRRRFQRA